MNHISIICLGVRDMTRSVRFYRDGPGFRTDCSEDAPRTMPFDTPDTKFKRYPLNLPVQDISGIAPPTLNTLAGRLHGI